MLDVGMPMCALIEVVRTIDAGLARTGSSAWIRKKGPLKLIASERQRADRLDRIVAILPQA